MFDRKQSQNKTSSRDPYSDYLKTGKHTFNATQPIFDPHTLSFPTKIKPNQSILSNASLMPSVALEFKHESSFSSNFLSTGRATFKMASAEKMHSFDFPKPKPKSEESIMLKTMTEMQEAARSLTTNLLHKKLFLAVPQVEIPLELANFSLDTLERKNHSPVKDESSLFCAGLGESTKGILNALGSTVVISRLTSLAEKAATRGGPVGAGIGVGAFSLALLGSHITDQVSQQAGDAVQASCHATFDFGKKIISEITSSEKPIFALSSRRLY